MGISQLEFLYDLDIKKEFFLDRKFEIKSNKTLIIATRQSGITSFLYQHLKEYKKGEYLYIDFKDTRVDKEKIAKDLHNFIKSKNIKILVLEGYDFSFNIPTAQKTIVTTETKKDVLEGYELKHFFPLDFEEFISFQKRAGSIEQIFNAYANTGTFPRVALSKDIEKTKTMQEILTAIIGDKKELNIYKFLTNFQGLNISTYSLFKKIKTDIKISKDSFYEIFSKLNEKNLIITVEKYGSPKSSKKIYLIDFAAKNALSFQKDFIKRFENMIFLELFKKGYDIFYTDEIDFYLPKEKTAILSIPFVPENLLKNKITSRKKHFIKYGIKRVEIISVGNEALFYDDGIEYEITPFWRWAIALS